MLVGSPYVSSGVADITGMAPRGVDRTLITRTDLRDFASGASNLDSLCDIARDGVNVRTLSRLHAKVYVFDDSAALVTSANATTSGLHSNLECGLATDDREIVQQLAATLLGGFGADEPPRVVSLRELESLYPPLKALRATLLDRPDVREVNQDESPFLFHHSVDFPEHFTGWKRLTMRGVVDMPEEEFTIDQLHMACSDAAANQYPKNNNVQAKLRQQLQVLRDIGLVEFVSPGFYRRTTLIAQAATPSRSLLHSR